MMNYETFKAAVKEKFLSCMPENYRDMEVRIESVDKTNCRMDGLSLFKVGGERTVFPTIYINTIYDEYLKSGDLQGALQGAADAMDRAFQETTFSTLDIDTAKDNIIFQLVNTAQNEGTLKNRPHREFLDLSIIYKWVVGMGEERISFAVIDNNLAKKLDMDETQLFEVAKENTRRIQPPIVKTMNEIIGDMALAGDMPLDEEMPQVDMWIITNESGINGAASMLYKDELHKLAENLKSDLYIMPSSIHEVIAIPAECREPEKLAQMVTEINMSVVRPDERLSNQVYYYDKSLRKLTIAAGTQKSLA